MQARLLELARAEADRALATTRHGAAHDERPAPHSKPPEGAVEMGAKTGLVAQIVARALVQEGAREIVAGVAGELGPDTGTLVVDDRALTASHWRYTLVRRELAAQREDLAAALGLFGVEASQTSRPEREKLGPAAPPDGVLAAAPPLLGTVADLIGMFRTDYKVTASEVAMGTTPLVAAVAGALRAREVRVVVEGFQLPEARTIEDFMDARRARAMLERRLASDLAAVDSRTAGEPDERSPARHARVGFAKTAIARWDAFSSAVLTSGAADAYPPLVAAALQERLHEGADRLTRVLYVGIEGTGGETITRRSLFRSSRKLAIVGGSQLSWLLLNTATSETIAAGTKALLGQLIYDLKTPSLTEFKRLSPDWGPA